jgi:regulation of enolase protein 1 (concanavalin A-like superfamily)
LPSPWSDADIGAPTPAGSATYAGSVFTINGGGNDIWGTAGGNLDQFNYVSQPLTNTSETITARVTSQTNSSAWAKAGIMIKQSTTAGSPYALLAVTPGNGITFQYNYNGSVGGGAYTFPNGWLRLSLAAGTVTAYSSANGSTWTKVGSTPLTLTSPATIGLFVCSHNAGALSTATIDNVSLTSP